MTTLDSERTQISAESYFKTQPPPPTLEHDIASVRSFIHRQRDLGNKVVLVTVSIRPHPPSAGSNVSHTLKSGGTTVPLELNV